jgi:hypothetical protein
VKELPASIIGFLVAPIVPALGAGLTTPIVGTSPSAKVVIALFPIAYEISFVAILVVGVPLFLIGRRLRLIRWWTALITGLVAGVVVALVFQWDLLTDVPTEPLNVQPATLLLYGTEGALAAFLFWLVWRQSQPRNGNRRS